MPLLIRGVILFSIDVILGVFHISVLFYLCRRRGKDERLQNGFFTLYIVVSIIDCLAMGFTGTLIHLMNTGMFVDLFLSCEICAKVQVEIATYLRTVQTLGHTLIAFNRYTCFCASRRLHQCLWEGRWTRWILATTVLAPLPLLTIQLPHSVAYTVYDGRRYAAFYVDVEWNKTYQLMYTIIYAICTALNLAFSMAAVVRLHRLRRMNMLSYVTRNSDIRLFAHSLAMFIIQTLIVLMYLHFSGLVRFTAFALIVQYGARSWCDAHSLSGSVFLMVLSDNVRHGYFLFYGCRNNHIAPALQTFSLYVRTRISHVRMSADDKIHILTRQFGITT